MFPFASQTDPCENSKCRRGSKCQVNNSAKEGYSCRCKNGTKGRYCEQGEGNEPTASTGINVY